MTLNDKKDVRQVMIDLNIPMCMEETCFKIFRDHTRELNKASLENKYKELLFKLLEPISKN